MSAQDDDGVAGASPDHEDVHSILSDIAAEGELARLEAKLEELEGDVGRLAADLDGDRAARGGELDVMRARVEDALTFVGEATEEQRKAWDDLESRLETVRQQLDERLAGSAEDLRAEMAAVRDRAAAITEETELRLQADITELIAGLEERISEHVDRRMEMEVRRSNAIESRLDTRIEEEGQRWLEGLERGVRGLREAIGGISSSLESERGARGEADRGLHARIDDIGQRLERVEGRSDTASRKGEVELSRVERRLVELGDRIDRLEHRDGTDEHDVAATVAELTERVERAETIAREAGRAIVGALRRQREEGEGRPEPADPPSAPPTATSAGSTSGPAGASPLRAAADPDEDDRLF